MLIKCPECGKQISDKMEACPNCGAPQPASLRTAALEKRRVARRRTIRIMATITVVAALVAAATFALLYRWPISYEVGTVTGTDTISGEDLVKAVDDAAASWNNAAGRIVAWCLPLGKRVRSILGLTCLSISTCRLWPPLNTRRFIAQPGAVVSHQVAVLRTIHWPIVTAPVYWCSIYLYLFAMNMYGALDAPMLSLQDEERRVGEGCVEDLNCFRIGIYLYS